MRCRGPGQWREFRLGSQVVPLYMPERERRSSKDAKITAPLQLTEVVHRLNKYLAAKNALPRLTEAVATLVKEPDSPTGRIKEERFRLVLEEVASQVLEADEMLAVFPEKVLAFAPWGCDAQAKESKLQRDHTGAGHSVQAAGRAGAEGDSATLLALLRRLRRQGHPGIRWENDQLNRKLAHQLSQPLLTAGGVVPAWVKALPLTYPFLFERKLKEQLLHCMGFGTSHAVLWLQRRCVEARFGEQLRNAREQSGPDFPAMSGRPVASASRLVIFAILFLLTGYVTIVPFLVPKAQVGIILSTQGWASVAALIPSGFAIDKYGAKAILQLGVAMAMGGIALAASASFHSQLISRVVVGAATSVIFNAAMALIMEHFVEPLRSEHLGLAVGLGSLGNVAGPLLVGALFDGARIGGLPEPQFWCLVPPLLGFAAVWQMLRAVPDKSEPLLDPEDDSSLLAKACGGVFLFRRAKVLVLTLELVCIFAANNAFMTLGAIELHRRGFSSSQIGMMTMPSGLFQCLLSQWAGRFAGSAVNRERVLLATPLLLGLALLPLSLLG
ncbi:unnamed protein product, partial [Effrenium voratum]